MIKKIIKHKTPKLLKSSYKERWAWDSFKYLPFHIYSIDDNEITNERINEINKLYQDKKSPKKKGIL